ncbi:MAG: hypothetical protein ACK5D5_08160 [Bacteroidota bacterium]|jgi:hypothetical protein
MKKITLIGLGIVAISLTACKKDRVCECTEQYTANFGGSQNTTTTTSSFTLVDVSKATAKRICVSTSSSNANYSQKTTCELK